jgi:hypothetical protein
MILPVVLYRYETRSLDLRDELKSDKYGNREGRIFGSKKEEIPVKRE